MERQDPELTATALLAEVGWIRALARGIARDAAGADDLVQEAFVAALRRPPEPGTPLRAWVRRVLGNRARSDARRAGTRALAEGGSEAQPASAAEAPDRLVERAELHRRLVEEVLRLDERTRACVLLRYFEGLAPAEVAARRGEPLGTVTSRLARAHAALRARLEGEPGGSARALALLVAGERPARTSVPPAAGGSPAASGLATSLAMSAGSKLALSLAVVLSSVLAVAWWRHARPARPASLSAIGSRDLVSDGGSLAMAAESARATALSTPTEPRSSRVRERVEEPEDEGSGSGTNDPVVEARLVDEARRPIGDAVIELAEGSWDAVVQSSGPDGRASLRISGVGGGQFRLRLSAPGRASLYRSEYFLAGEPLFLGELVLPLPVVLAGRVVDEAGAPVADVPVAVTGADVWGRAALALWRGPDTDEAPTARTDAAGTFRFEDVAPGPRRVWASPPGGPSTFTETLHLEAGASREDLVLVLASFGDGEHIRGQVVGPDGAPAPDVDVSAVRWIERSTSSERVTVDAEGRFDVVAPAGHVVDLEVRDRRRRCDPLAREGLTGGMHDVVLRLRERMPFVVLATDAAGEPVERFEVRVHDRADYERRGAEDVLPSRPRATYAAGREPGRAEIARPERAFLVEVLAPGFEAALAGPFDPSSPGPARLVLARLPGLRGRVTAGGEPVAGAMVALHRRRDDVRAERDFLPVRFLPQAVEETETDADGAFLLTPRERGTYHVVVESPTYATGEVGPLELDPRSAADELRIELTRGGGLAGRVRLEPGAELEGVLVGASRGDGRTRVAHTDAAGRFALDRLTPGDWFLRGLPFDTGHQPGMTLLAPPGSGAGRDSNDEDLLLVRIAEGRTADVVLDLRPRNAVRLQGRLTIAGVDTGSWVVDAWSPVGMEVRTEPSGIVLAEGGRFELGRERPGALTLRFTSPLEQGSLVQVQVNAELEPGSQAWSLDLAAGTVLADVPPALAAGEPWWRLVCELPEGGTYTRRFTPPGDRPLALEGVPPGEVRLLSAPDLDTTFRNRTTTSTLAAGETLVLGAR